MEIVQTRKKSVSFIMQKDDFLLKNLKNQPVLHFYEWESDSLTYGYFIEISKYINIKKAEKMGLSMARRPTGGGIVFHLWDLAFSFLMPSRHKNFFLNPLDNYKFVNSIILDAIKEFLKEGFLYKDLKNDLSISNFCMAKPSKYDIVYKGKKIVGASQRKIANGYLHQASICLVYPDIKYLKEVLVDKKNAKIIFTNSYPLFLSKDIDKKRLVIKKNLINSFKKRFF